MKNELLFSEKYALLSLDGLEILHNSSLKTLVKKAAAAAVLLEEALQCGNLSDLDTDSFESLLSRIRAVRNYSRSTLSKILDDIVKPLRSMGLLEEIPDLLACDINYYTAGVSMTAYRSSPDEYTKTAECIRAEALEENSMTEETFCLLWLLRESGLLYDFFSSHEQDLLNSHMIDFTAGNANYLALYHTAFHDPGLIAFKKLVGFKNKVTENPVMEGVTMIFPFLNRRQSIFIDTVLLGTSCADRRMSIMSFLSEHGHFVDDSVWGDEKILKIDNCYYRLFPSVRTFRLPVQGIVLLPIYK